VVLRLSVHILAYIGQAVNGPPPSAPLPAASQPVDPYLGYPALAASMPQVIRLPSHPGRG
jgi:hypothetical protein